MEGLLFLLGLVVVLTPIMVIVSLIKISGLKYRVFELETKVKALEGGAFEAVHKQQATEVDVGAGAYSQAQEQAQRQNLESERDFAWVQAQRRAQEQGQEQGRELDKVPSVPSMPPASAEQEMHPAAIAQRVQTTQAAALQGQATSSQVVQVLTEPHSVQAGEVVTETPSHIQKDEQTTLAADGSLPVSAAAPVEQAAPQEVKPKRTPRLPEKPELVERALNALKRWFTTGNVPVKVGILVLFAGVAALLKYVTDQGWIRFPIEARLAGIAGLALGALVFAWRKREQQRVFSLSVQGGAIGILLLTVFAAFKLYPDFAPLAFGVTVLLVACAGLLAVVQNARILAVFAILAGFLSPIWLSTGSGNHVALFSYYAILNAAIFGMSWWRSWRMLNLLGFAFTFGIGTLWGVLKYVPEHFASTEPFLLLFFVFYLLIPILYARKFVGSKRDLVDAALVFGTPLVAFSLQAMLLQDNRYALAGSAFGLGVLYAALTRVLANKEKLKELVPAYMALAGGFLTLAVPLAFSAQQTSCIYALEGAALVWWGVKQSRGLSQLSGLGLQLLGAVAFVFTLGQVDLAMANAIPVLNASLINMVMMAGAGFLSAWCYYRSDEAQALMAKWGQSKWSVSSALYVWGLSWWCLAGIREISLFSAPVHMADFALMFVVLTAWLASQANRQCQAGLLRMTTGVGLALPMGLAVWQVLAHNSPLTEWGWAGWLVYGVLGARSIYNGRQDKGSEVALSSQFLWWPTWALVATLALRWWGVQYALVGEWFWVVQALPVGVLLGLSLWRWPVLRLPLGECFDALRDHLQALFIVVGTLAWLLALLLPANSVPLPWVPVFNPIELLQLGFVGMVWYWLRRQNTQKFFTSAQQMVLGAGAVFLLISVMTLRMVHHWGNVPWHTVFMNPLAQTWLSMVWSVLGAGLVWWGIREHQQHVQKGGMGLQLLGGGAFGLSMTGGAQGSVASMVIVNLTFMNMLLLALAGLWSAWCYFQSDRKTDDDKERTPRYAGGFYLWGLAWWCAMGLHEVSVFVSQSYQASVVLVLVALTGWLAAEVEQRNGRPGGRQQSAGMLCVTTVVGIGLGVLLVGVQTRWQGSPFFSYGWLAWVGYGVLGWRAITGLRSSKSLAADVAQLIWWPIWALVLGLALNRWSALTLGLGADWCSAALVLPWLVLIGVSVWRAGWVGMPLGVRFAPWLPVLQKGLFALGLAWWVYALGLASSSAPLPWVPVFNPIDAIQLVFLGVLLQWVYAQKERIAQPLSRQVMALSVVVFLLSSVMTLRAVHHWGGIPWDNALPVSKLAQTCLSVVWSVLGVLAWIRGSRRGWRELWWAGAVLMIVVLAKLLLVDRSNLGNVLGITSFIAYGVLCVVVGYFAPAPPKGVLQVEGDGGALADNAPEGVAK